MGYLGVLISVSTASKSTISIEVFKMQGFLRNTEKTFVAFHYQKGISVEAIGRNYGKHMRSG
jgi:hypothetical protein